jgi:hypothetical protein
MASSSRKSLHYLKKKIGRTIINMIYFLTKYSYKALK